MAGATGPGQQSACPAIGNPHSAFVWGAVPVAGAGIAILLLALTGSDGAAEPQFALSFQAGENPTKELDASWTARFNLTVYNIGNATGNATANITNSADLPGWSRMQVPDPLSGIGPGVMANFTLYIFVPLNAPNGTYTVNVEALVNDSPQSPSGNELQLGVVVPKREPKFQIALQPGETGIRVTDLLTRKAEFYLTITNTGNTNGTPDLNLSLAGGWAWEQFPDPVGNIAPGGPANFTLHIFAPPGALNDTYLVKVRALVNGSPQSPPGNELTLMVAVPQWACVEVIAPPADGGGPGSAVTMPFTVVNCGNGRDWFRITTLSIGNPGWAVTAADADNVTAAVGPGQSAVKQIRVAIPWDAVATGGKGVPLAIGFTSVFDTAANPEGPAMDVNTTYIAVKAHPGPLSLYLDREVVEVLPGEHADFTFNVSNGGNVDDTLNVTATIILPLWTVNIQSRAMPLPAFGVGRNRVAFVPPSSATPGEYNATLQVTSSFSSGIRTTATVKVVVRQPGYFTLSLPQTEFRLAPGTAGTLRVLLTAYNGYGGDITLAVTTEDGKPLPAWLEARPGLENPIRLDGALNFTLKLAVSRDAAAGRLVLNLSADDGRTVAQSRNLTVVVESENRPPRFTGTPPTTATAGMEFLYQATADDDDGDALAFSLSGFIAGMTIDAASGRIVWTPTPEQTGNWTVAVAASDGRGGRAEQTFVVRVVPPAGVLLPPAVGVNGRPLPAGGNLKAGAGAALHLEASAAAGVDMAGLRFRWDFGDGTSGDGASANHTYTTPDRYRVSLAVEDRYGRVAYHNFTVDVSRSGAAVAPSFPFVGPPLFAAVALVVVAFVILGGTEQGLWLLLTALLPLYTRIAKHAVLDNFVRGQVHGYILANPGEHYRGLRQALKLPNGTLAYHLHVLHRAGLIQFAGDGPYKRFYPRGMSLPTNGHRRIQEMILSHICERPGTTMKEIAAAISVAPATVTYHVDILRVAGLVRVERSWRRAACFPIEGEGDGAGDDAADRREWDEEN